MEKMTIENAREIAKQTPLTTHMYDLEHAKGFIEGYESREAELKNKYFELEGRLLASQATYSALLKMKEKVRCPMCGESK